MPAIKNAKLASFFMDMNKDIRIQIDLHCASEQDAALVETFAVKDLGGKRQAVARKFGADAQPILGIGNEPSKVILNEVNKNFKIEKQGSTVSASSTPFRKCVLRAIGNLQNVPRRLPLWTSPKGKGKKRNRF